MLIRNHHAVEIKATVPRYSSLHLYTGRFAVGQNLFISFQSNFDNRVQWGRAIKAWYDEVADFPNDNINQFQ